MKWSRLRLFALVAVLVAAASVQAATITWVGPTTDEDVTKAANWNPAQVPTDTDTVIFNGSGSTDITSSGTVYGDIMNITANQNFRTLKLSPVRAVNVASGVTGSLFAAEADLGNHTVTFNVASGGRFYTQKLFSGGSAAVLKTGAGEFYLERNDSVTKVNSYRVDQGTLTIQYWSPANTTITLNGADAVFNFNGNQNLYSTTSISGTGTFKITAAGARMNSGFVLGSLNGDMIIDGAGNVENFGAVSFAGLNGVTAFAGDATYRMYDRSSATFTALAGSVGTIDAIDIKVVANVTLTLGKDGLATADFGGTIEESGIQHINLIKTGNNTQILSGINTYSGTTTVSGGTLLVNGIHTGGGDYSVTSGATLGGTGTIDALVTIGGTSFLAPGASPGVLTVTDLTLQDGATVNFEPGDRTDVTNTLTLPNEDWILALTGNQATWALGGYTVVFNYGSLSGTSWEGQQTTVPLDFSGITGFASGAFNDVYLFNDTENSRILLMGMYVIPEAETSTLLLGGVLALLAFRRLRHA